ncbi:MAG TPA: hypothetical protein VHB98_05500 [Chloroflexota bacterium]|nr:hypothetical protein [Chloroflexota bacterium]
MKRPTYARRKPWHMFGQRVKELLDCLRRPHLVGRLMTKQFSKCLSVPIIQLVKENVGVLSYDTVWLKGSGWKVRQIHRHHGVRMRLDRGGEHMPVLWIACQGSDMSFVVCDQHVLQREKEAGCSIQVCNLLSGHALGYQEIARHFIPDLCTEPDLNNACFLKAEQGIP